MKKFLILNLLSPLFFVIVPTFAIASVLTDARMDFSWTISDGVDPVPSYGTYYVNHDYSYTDDWSDEEEITSSGSYYPPDTITSNSTSTDGTNYANSEINISATSATPGATGYINTTTYSALNTGGQYSYAINHTGTWNLDIFTPVNSDGLANSPNWLMSLDIDTLTNSIITGSATDQQSVAQYWFGLTYHLYDGSGQGHAYTFIGPDNIQYDYTDTLGNTLTANEFLYDFYLNPYDSNFNIDLTFDFVPTHARLQLDFEVNSSASVYQQAEDPGTPPNPVPEPSTWVLLSTGLAGLAWYGRKRKKE